MLAATAERLRSVVRAADVVGRLGGEEFVLILPGVDAEAAEDCAERARAALAELTVRGRPLAASAGVAAAPGRRGRGRRAAGERRRRAVLGQALRPRRGRVRYVRRRRSRPEAEQRAEIAALLERGTAAMRTVFQPVVELATGRAGGYEALTRFESEPRARAGRVVRAGASRRARARSSRRSRCAPRWRSRAAPRARSWRVNVSPRALLSRRPCAPRCRQDLTGIVVELTEHELFGAEGELETELAALRARGARVALDDAGAGYAGLQQIIRIAPDILKLDRALVHGAHADGSRQALLEALIGFAATTGAAVCAEGVEDLDDVRALVALDVTYAQGYGLARPGAAVAGAAGRGDAAGAAEIRAGLRVAIAPARRRGRVRQRHGRARRRAGRRDVDRRPRRRDRAAPPRMLRADDVALMQVDRAADALVLRLRPQRATRAAQRWPLDDFPATRYVLDHRVPGQVVAGDDAGDPAELAELEALGMATLLIVPIVYGGRELAVLEVYRTLPQAFTVREVDRARVARPAVRRGARPPHIKCSDRSTSEPVAQRCRAASARAGSRGASRSRP